MDPKLLDKYWNGETSLEEENLLRSEAEQDAGPEGAWFRMLAEAGQAQSRLTPDLITGTRTQARPTIAVVRPLVRRLAAAAAILALALSGFGLWQYSHRPAPGQLLLAEATPGDTYDDPEKALEEVREALAFMSSRFQRTQDKAFRQIQKAGEYADIIR